MKKPKKSSKCLINLAQASDYGFIILRRFVYWNILPFIVQSKILFYYKFDVVACLNFKRVSKSFKEHVELMHKDIHSISLGICSKKHWLNKTLPAFIEMVYRFESFTNIDRFNRKELLEIYSEDSLFRVLLHMFFCKRSCDRVENFCWECSRVRDRNFRALTIFDDVILEERDIYSKLGIQNKQIDFDVFLSYFGTTNSIAYGNCEWNQTIQYAGDVFVLFVSILIRVNLNVYYDYFLSIPLT